MAPFEGEAAYQSRCSARLNGSSLHSSADRLMLLWSEPLRRATENSEHILAASLTSKGSFTG